MSLPDEEARALDEARTLLGALSSGQYKVTSVTALRKGARHVLRHFPLAAGERWLLAAHKEIGA